MPGIQSLTNTCNDNTTLPHQPGDHLALVSDLSFCTLPAVKGNIAKEADMKRKLSILSYMSQTGCVT